MSSPLPQSGQTIIFTAVPPGSYASTDTLYRVERARPGHDFHLVNVAKGTGTYESPFKMRRSEWRVAA